MPGGGISKQTPEVLASLAESLNYGLSRRQAAARARIDYETLKAWCRDDPVLSAHLAACEAEGIFAAATTIRHADKDSGPAIQGAKFYLATRRVDPWTERKHVEQSGKVAVSLAQILAPDLTTDQTPPDDDEDGE